jgi:hypothetical protein
VWEETAAMEAARVTAVLAAETSAQEATVAWDSATFCIKGAEDRAALVEREARERVSRVEAENTVPLASAHEDVEGRARKVTLLEGELLEARQA